MSDQHLKGVFSRIKTRLHRNRLGEILVHDGVLAPAELKLALQGARLENVPLGRYLVSQNQVTAFTVRKALAEQFALRFMTAAVTIFISMAGMGAMKTVSAASIKDVPARVAFTNAAAYSPVASYPKVFGSSEKKSGSLTAFTKWIGMFDKFDAALNTSHGNERMQQFVQELSEFKDLPLDRMAISVNAMLNQVAYTSDNTNYGKSDYWATPIEFLTRGGDCEDYAIAKYTALRMLGVPEERLRIMILQDMQKNIPHAVLVVYTDDGSPLILDNQIKAATRADRISHYKPIFSINRNAWWLHTKPAGNVTVVASASR